ncbi:MAG: hypothetical protein LW724_05150 [Planctomycetaceae bacterium]|nr:hypothetical protein [Planctomycetaceae bacterium]
MERTEPASFAHGLKQLPETWNEFWFSPVTLGTMDRVRQLFGLTIAFQFVSYLFWVPQWLSGDGWLGSQAGRYLIGQGMPDTGSQYRWSILYWLTSPLAGQAVCVIGFLASVLMFLGIGHRSAPILAWACMMMVHHRAPWLTMPSELLMSAALFYLAIEPGASLLLKRSHKESADRCSVLANIALRCLQIHWVLWVGLSLASMLQQPVWWNGEALGLLSEQGSGWFGKVSRSSELGQCIGLAFLMLHPLSLLCLCNRRFRSLGVLFTILLGMGYILLTGDLLLGLIAGAYALAFVPESIRVGDIR